AFARAGSPALAAAIPRSTTSEQQAAIVRRQVFENAKTVGELVAAVPANYRETLSGEIRAISEQAEKLVAAKSSLRKLESFTDGNPPHLKLKAPELQASKEFREGGIGLFEAQEAIGSAVTAAEKTILATAISTKKAEVKFLEGLIDFKAVFDRMMKLVVERWATIRERNQVPVLQNAPDDTTGTMVHVTGWNVDPAAKAEYENLLADLASIGVRATALVELRDLALRKKIEKKHEIAKSADVEMADLTKPGPSIQSTVDKAVAARIKPLTAQLAKLSVKGGNSAAKKLAAKASKKADAKKSQKSKKASPAKAAKSTKSDKGKGKGKAKAGTYSVALLPYPTAF
ncbi:hypothetical protein FKP32DRAFT_1546210, partial [Trametes sanguinea]